MVFALLPYKGVGDIMGGFVFDTLSGDLLSALKNSYNEIVEYKPDTAELYVILSDGTFPKTDKLYSVEDNSGLIHPDDVKAFGSTINAECFKQGISEKGETKRTVEIRRLASDGKYRWCSVSIVVTVNDDGKMICCIFTRDIDDTKKQEISRLQKSMNIDSAFKESCVFVCEVSIKTGRIKIIKHDSDRTAEYIPEHFDILAEMMGRKYVCEEDREEFISCVNIESIADALETGSFSLFYRINNDSGEVRWDNCIAIPSIDEETGEKQFIYYVRDVTEEKESQEMQTNLKIMQKELEYRRMSDYHEARYKAIIEQTDIVSFEFSLETEKMYISPNFAKKISTSVDTSSEIVLNDIKKMIAEGVVYDKDIPAFTDYISEFREAKVNECTCRLRTVNGEYCWFKFNSSPVSDGNGCGTIIGTLQDVDNQFKAMKALKIRAEKDLLTGLNNEAKFFDDIDMVMHDESGRKFALVLFDIDKFKIINEVHGGKAADKLLRSIGMTLRAEFSDKLSVGRLQGDNFGILTEYKDTSELVAVAEKIAELLGVYEDIRYTTSCGIYKIEKRNANPRSVFDYAKLAKSTIKGNLMETYAFYDETVKTKMLYDKEIEDEMELALIDRQFEMWLQPKYDIASAKIIGAEALVRWNHPIKGLIPPGDFIPLFERNGFIVKLDEYMWREACITIRDWLDKEYEPVPISVNVSRLHISNPNLIKILNDMTAEYNIPKKLLELEITESVFYDNQKQLFEALIDLKNEGYMLLMDDFGSGYSSLNMLKNTPFDVLKIDRGFLNETMVTDRGKKIILHTIAMTNDIGLKIIAEGVEDKSQAEYLLACGCDSAQGYYYSKPVPRSEFNEKAFGEKHSEIF